MKSRPWLRQTLFQLAGFALLVALCTRLPLDSLSAALAHTGPGTVVVCLLATVFIVTEMIAMSILLEGRVPPLVLFHAETVADAIARLVPAAGLAGDPYRAARYAPYVGADFAGRAAVDYRLIHMIAGLFFTVVTMGVSLVIAPVPPAWQATFWAVMAVSAVLSALLAGVALSALPARLTAVLLKRFNIPADATAMLPRGEFVRALIAKELSLAFQLVEMYAIFVVLGIPPSWAGVFLTAAMIAASATVFFMMPQGLGVNEAGVSAAFAMLGIPPAEGVAFGLIRRARIIVWTLLGVALHLIWTRRPEAAEGNAAAAKPTFLGQ
ncbi:MAG: hypothetical protein FJX76_08630 [Armatimonadetes bacterium]|nr:hypothetical protein [Armatimonadota bacterium]